MQFKTCNPFGIYIHIPFCQRRCGYCDFNTYVLSEYKSEWKEWKDNIIKELSIFYRTENEFPPVSTIFFGGGTPTLVPAEYFQEIVTSLRSMTIVENDCEISVETNPDTVTFEQLCLLAEMECTRLSIGMQSSQQHVLHTLDRIHNVNNVKKIVANARRAGIKSVSLDLIYGTPGETFHDWQQTLQSALTMEPDHISAYGLIVEAGTKLHDLIRRGAISAPDDDEMSEKYIFADELLTTCGYRWYEISNWAKTNEHQCRHNKLYWMSNNWLGVGPGAHSHIDGYRWWNKKLPKHWEKLLDAEKMPMDGDETLTLEQQEFEKIMLRLRMPHTLSSQQFSQETLSDLVSQGLCDVGETVTLTKKGRLLANQVVLSLAS